MNNGKITLLLAAALLVPNTAATAANFADMSRDQIRAEIKARCVDQMADYGDSMTLACMKQDWQAAQQVKTALEDHPTVAKKCLLRMRKYGYSLVNSCIKQDTQASNAIADW